MAGYRTRVVDAVLDARLKAVGCVVLEGPKAVGKTATAARRAASEVRLDTDVNAREIARADHREEQMRQRVFGTDGDNRFGLRIQLDTVFRAIALHNFGTQPGNTARHRVAMIAWIAYRFDQFLNDRLGRGAIRVAHSEVYDILLRRSRFGLHLVDDGEHVGRQLLDAVKLVG